MLARPLVERFALPGRRCPTACENPNATAVGGIYGYSHTTGGYDGGQAQSVRVPFADQGAIPIPDDIEDDDALFAAKSAWFMGAGRVLVVEEYDYRLEFARKFAQAETLDFRSVRDVFPGALLLGIRHHSDFARYFHPDPERVRRSAPRSTQSLRISSPAREQCAHVGRVPRQNVPLGSAATGCGAR